MTCWGHSRPQHHTDAVNARANYGHAGDQGVHPRRRSWRARRRHSTAPCTSRTRTSLDADEIHGIAWGALP
jgi:hypothetical protein